LTQSAAAGNSNFYLYTNFSPLENSVSAGRVEYNSNVQTTASRVSLSRYTRDGVDIAMFLTGVSKVNVLYIQTQSSSDNFIKYNIIAEPSMTGFV
jgi:hypothetical protein